MMPETQAPQDDPASLDHRAESDAEEEKSHFRKGDEPTETVSVVEPGPVVSKGDADPADPDA